LKGPSTRQQEQKVVNKNTSSTGESHRDMFIWVDDRRASKANGECIKEYQVHYEGYTSWEKARLYDRQQMGAILTYLGGDYVVQDINDCSLQNPVSSNQPLTGDEILSDDDNEIGREFIQCYSQKDRLSGHIRHKHLSQIRTSSTSPRASNMVSASFPELPNRFFQHSPPTTIFQVPASLEPEEILPNAKQLPIFQSYEQIPRISQLEPSKRTQIIRDSQETQSEISILSTKHLGLYAAFLKATESNLHKTISPKIQAQSHSRAWTEGMLPTELINSNEYAKHYASSIFDLTVFTCKSMTEKRRSVTNANPDFVLDVVYEIFASTCAELIIGLTAALHTITFTNNILALIAGDLPRRRRINTRLRKTLELFDTHDAYPGIYGNWFVDKDGNPPTVAHMHNLLDGLKRYIRDHSFAAMVDKQFAVKMNNQWTGRDGSGYDKERRRYLGAGYPGDHQYERRRKRLDTIIGKWEVILDGMKLEERIPRTVIEIGWGSDCSARKEAHKKHYYSSNYLMNLFDATSKCLGLGYTIENHVIYPVWEPEQAGLAEAAFTDLSMGMVEDGFGFSYHPPGQNVGNSLKLAVRAYMFVQRNILQFGPFIQNLQTESRRWDKEVRKFNMLDADLKGMEARIRGLYVQKFQRLQEVECNLDLHMEALLSISQNKPFQPIVVLGGSDNTIQDSSPGVDQVEEHGDSSDAEDADDFSYIDDIHDSDSIEISSDGDSYDIAMDMM
jgi:hypothetical protein